MRLIHSAMYTAMFNAKKGLQYTQCTKSVLIAGVKSLGIIIKSQMEWRDCIVIGSMFPML